MKRSLWLVLIKYALLVLPLVSIDAMSASDEVIVVPKITKSILSNPAKEKSAGSKGNTQRSIDESRIELERLNPPIKQHASKGKNSNAFGSTSWYVPPPPPPPPPPAPPPVPTAPPVPFKFLGLYEEGNKSIIMLVRGDQVFTVSVGDVIENTYRIDHIDHGSVDITYMPLNIKQSINTGTAL